MKYNNTHRWHIRMCSRTACAIDEDHLIAAIRNGHTDIILLPPLSCNLYIQQELCHIKTILHKILKRLQKANRLLCISLAWHPISISPFLFSICQWQRYILKQHQRWDHLWLHWQLHCSVHLQGQDKQKFRRLWINWKVVKLQRDIELVFYLSYLSYFCHLIYYTCTYTVMWNCRFGVQIHIHTFPFYCAIQGIYLFVLRGGDQDLTGIFLLLSAIHLALHAAVANSKSVESVFSRVTISWNAWFFCVACV